ncbi:N-6 DNA Methylase [Parafrankia irregularis]|uniref:N-6 DNA Methylase n=1 Tax=Parafrankia irregularis TaxID=795642 RepID=A0A0S4R2F1_9ACTN|nr:MULTISPECIES: N-6 DNA methylase [Parafrankia]MBE3200407.1 SAM-dependent DNA methyltransferase [Parafrankia sp. CH37]CUU61078.1 N-6 DNA Methylase [Parafrankia irregularis]
MPAPPQIPLSVVAALALITPPSGELSATADLITELDTERFYGMVRLQWTIFVRARPDLLPAAWPLLQPWLGADRPDQAMIVAARRVAHAALDAGQLHLTGTPRRRDTDVFGPLLVALRADGARVTAGQFYTPGPIADVLAAGLTTCAQPGQTVIDPAIGTGGLFRAAAQTLRAGGIDPASMVWIDADIDAVAVACAAVNAVLWELGPTVALVVGDTLTDDWQTVAIAQRREILQIADRLHGAAFAADVLGTVARLVDAASTARAGRARRT